MVFWDNKIDFMYYSGGWRDVVDTSTIALNQWTHWAITADRTTYSDRDIITFWTNGAISSVTTSMYPCGSTDNQPFI